MWGAMGDKGPRGDTGEPDKLGPTGPTEVLIAPEALSNIVDRMTNWQRNQWSKFVASHRDVNQRRHVRDSLKVALEFLKLERSKV
jgi:hypothetical protein